MSSWRILLFCAVCIHQVCGREEHITGYLGQSVVLKTGANASWNLNKIQWSIYTNTTYIASLKDGLVTLYSVWTHQGRLELNTKTGDLTIKNVTMDDSMMYTVALVTSTGRVNIEVHLTVRERLRQPKIEKMLDFLKDGQCHVALNCTAYHRNVNLSWTPDGEFNGLYISGNAVDSSLVLYTSFSGNRNMTFNCTASNGQQTETKQITVGCSEKCEVCNTVSLCSSCASSVVLAILIITVPIFLVLGAYAFKKRDRIKETILNTLQNFVQNIRGTSSDSVGGEGKKGHKATEDKTPSLALI